MMMNYLFNILNKSISSSGIRVGFYHQMRHKNFYPYLLLLSISPIASGSQNDCIYEAAQCFKINPLIIKAIIWQESSNRQSAVNVNKNKTLDVGIMQINSIHFNELKLHGVSEKELREDSCANIFSGSWILNKVIQDNGYTWEGIGTYHSKTPRYRNVYASKIITIIRDDNSVIDKITVPYQTGIREKFSCG